MSPKLKILFLCTGNSCRSQMAEGLANFIKSQSVQAFSAGTAPQKLNADAVRVMREAGVDISQHVSKNVEALGDIKFDYVITVCDDAHEHCPIWPGRAKVIHKGFDDPPRLAASATTEVEALSHYRRVRDQIKDFIETLPEALEE